jgi:hypothetical protein
VKQLLVIAGLVLSHGAWAQNTSDIMPEAPRTGGAAGYSPYVPGMPAMQPSVPENSEPGTVTKAGAGKKEEPQGRYIYEESLGPGETAEAPQPGEPAAGVPEVHVVKKGDTLWDLSSTYFKNPWAWPKLWAYNPSITNPHWIYPGDLIRLAPPEAALAPSPAPAPAEAETTPRKITRTNELPTGLVLRQTGFAEPHELRAAGKIVGSKEEKIMLSTHDEAYVQFPPDEKVQPGDHLTIYKSIRPLVHPVTHKRLGDIVQIFGDVEVKSVTDGHIARVLVTDSDEPIERGFRVGPLRRQFKMVEPKAGRQDLSGVVVATIQPRELVGAGTLVFLDRGQKDGVEIGNRFLIVRRGDGYQPLLNRGKPVDDRRYPRETVGEVIVLDVRDNVSTGWVMHEAKETLVGDRVEEHRGY